MEIKYVKRIEKTFQCDASFYEKLYDVIAEFFDYEEIFSISGKPIADEFVLCFSENAEYCLDKVFSTNADAFENQTSKNPKEQYLLDIRNVKVIGREFAEYIKNNKING